jgi:dTDP-4-dehydrorhamnose reductase
MSVLVIGETGQLARSLVQRAAVRSIPLKTVGRAELDLAGDLRAIDAIIAEAHPSIVINAAAYTAVDRAETEPELAFRVNAEAVGLLGAACERAGVGIIHVSTDYVFDGDKSSPYTERDATAPLGVYGRSKLAGEEQLRAATRRHVIVRTSWVYSAFGNNFLKTMLRLGRERPQVSVVDDQIGNPTYAPHLADALLDAAGNILQDEGSEYWGTYHAAGSGETTWCGFAREIFSLAHECGLPTPQLTPIPTSQYPTPAKRPSNSRLECTLLEQRFGIRLPDWQRGVRECLADIQGQSAPLAST